MAATAPPALRDFLRCPYTEIAKEEMKAKAILNGKENNIVVKSILITQMGSETVQSEQRQWRKPMA